MTVSPRCAMALLSVPPVRGALSVLFLVMFVAVTLVPGEHGAAMRIGGGLAVLLLGVPLWSATLAGFVRDVRRPHRRGRTVVVASRPRPFAVTVSWIALGAVVGGLIGFGLVTGLGGPDPAAALCLLATVLGLPTAAVLPRLSRWHADGSGVVAVCERGLHVTARPGEEVAAIPWDRLGPIGDLPPDVGGALGRRVRWHPGAREAVGRWAQEGFSPTAAEVRALRLDPAWSADPAAHEPTSASRRRRAAELAWALTLCTGLLAGLIGLVVTGTSPWWALPAFGWAPLLAIWFLVPHRGRRGAGSSERGIAPR
ncbi:hypothetical protein BF93_11835 [Brachybacterium phenoliresistens]|uniref:Uncharacterized protein n=1 Tax=Brachybacterium phenoliresistens TaxID=396014 RepID=Z9JWT8_9MICO|nr:hypothetical protein [Brachybacterium phenoliresistens]EWS82463.1 hypothetical protein BF93_11835 [Brachybacterium phenoliresistens]